MYHPTTCKSTSFGNSTTTRNPLVCSMLWLLLLLVTFTWTFQSVQALSLSHSSFVSRCSSSSSSSTCWSAASARGSSRTITMYHDTPKDGSQNAESSHNAWSVLAKTEAWISSTLASSNAPSSATGSSSSSSSTSSSPSNPYSRKEVSYACETQSEGALIVAGIFRRLKEARELGQDHAKRAAAADDETTSETEPDDPADLAASSATTLRQTRVVVIPGNRGLTESFATFDGLIAAINQARRNARDYVLDDVSSSSLSSSSSSSVPSSSSNPNDWSIAVNCAHLHPSYGVKTPEQMLKELKEQQREREEGNGVDEEEEVDVHYEAYKEKRLLARRSPYPTVVVEVRAMPPPPNNYMMPPQQQQSQNGNAPGTQPTNTDMGHPPLAAWQRSSSDKYNDYLSNQNSDDTNEEEENDDDDDDDLTIPDVTVSAADVQKLEALFGKAAHFKTLDDDVSTIEEEPKDTATVDATKDVNDNNEEAEEDDDLWGDNALFDNLLGNVLTEISSVKPTPLHECQDWIAALENKAVSPKEETDKHHHYLPAVAAFTETNAVHVDEAFEFVFANIAMLMDDNDTDDQNDETSSSSSSSNNNKEEDPSSSSSFSLHQRVIPEEADTDRTRDATGSTSNTNPHTIRRRRRRRHYLVMPHFVSAAATSFDKFAAEVTTIAHVLPELAAGLTVAQVYHPEHVDPDRRSPAPLLALEWTTSTTTSSSTEPPPTTQK